MDGMNFKSSLYLYIFVCYPYFLVYMPTAMQNTHSSFRLTSETFRTSFKSTLFKMFWWCVCIYLCLNGLTIDQMKEITYDIFHHFKVHLSNAVNHSLSQASFDKCTRTPLKNSITILSRPGLRSWSLPFTETSIGEAIDGAPASVAIKSPLFSKTSQKGSYTGEYQVQVIRKMKTKRAD